MSGTMDAEYELSNKLVERNVLELEIPDEELWDDEEFQRLQMQIQELKRKLADGSA